MHTAWMVFVKEMVDALRDRRTLMMVLISAVAVGPLMLAALSAVVSMMEERADAREVMAVGLDAAPTLSNFLVRQGYTVKTAPADYEKKLTDAKLGDPVLVVGPTFEAELVAGEMPRVTVVTATGNQRAQLGTRRLETLLTGFNQERGSLQLALRGVPVTLAQAVEVQSRDVASPQARAAQLTAMLPFFIIMAVIYGAMNAGLDVTAGERERGSLEPLLMNPAPRWALVLGKWGAVAMVGMAIAVLSSLSFLPGQWLMRSEELAALFQYGWREALAFLVLLLPLAGATAALLMAVAIRSKSFKEAQASATIALMAFTMTPLIGMLSPDGEQPWHVWVPGLAQYTLMGRVLRGEGVVPTDVAATVMAAVVVTAVSLVYVSRSLSRSAIK
ncbi:MAG: ABC transporter permease subunit [Proteobacteria bacterium]|nr:ABC transporter permease subunit [Pseudomonadota bacterium]